MPPPSQRFRASHASDLPTMDATSLEVSSLSEEVIKLVEVRDGAVSPFILLREEYRVFMEPPGCSKEAPLCWEGKKQNTSQ